MITLNVNGKDTVLDIEPEMPVLWAVREQLGLTGTKFGCGIAQCGACTVLMDGQPVRSCSYPAAAAVGRKIVTIEGLSPDASHPVQQAWRALDVPQCGYCQSGQILTAAALLQRTPKPTDADIDEAMTNLCRCGTYVRIRAAVHHAAGQPGRGGSVVHMVKADACDGACPGALACAGRHTIRRPSRRAPLGSVMRCTRPAAASSSPRASRPVASRWASTCRCPRSPPRAARSRSTPGC